LFQIAAGWRRNLRSVALCLRELSESGPAALRDLSKPAQDGKCLFYDEEWKEQEATPENEETELP